MGKKSIPRKSLTPSLKMPPVATGGREEAPTPESALAEAGALGIAPSRVSEPTTKSPDELARELQGLLVPVRKMQERLTKDRLDLERAQLELIEEQDKLEVRRKAHEEKAMRLDRDVADLRKQRSELDEAKATFEARESELRKELEAKKSAFQKELDARESRLLAREEAVIAREADADAGFIVRRTEMLASAEAAAKRLFAAIDAREKAESQAALDRLAEVDKRTKEMRDQLATRLREAETSMAEREEELERKAKAIERQIRRLRVDESHLEAMEKDLEDLVAKRAEERVTAAEEAVQRLRARCERLDRELEERRRASQLLANEPPEQTVARMEALKTKLSELESELASRPSREEMNELERLREERTTLQNERFRLERQIQEQGRRLETLRVDVGQVEMLRDCVLVKDKHVELLGAAIEELREDVDNRLDRDRSKPIFAALSKLDDDPALKVGPESFWTPVSAKNEELKLDAFAEDLQHRIGKGAGSHPDLYFDLDDIRGLLGGLAMSRMHLYQGISGIGKSSLPRRFASAVGGLCESVSVQAGWRDRQDLFGYYNAFDKTYHETEFVKALYKAQLPKWRDRLIIILLDEMNLSHPEQYGADILDVLERRDWSERRFQLLSSDTGQRRIPDLLDNGAIKLPRNVWFVGTANHDETTKDFADKTYDRSFVLELPGTPPKVMLKEVEKRPPVQLIDIVNTFKSAENAHKGAASKALDWMAGNLRQVLVENFGISWGGRLETQAQRFIPVFVAAGGNVHAALDRLLATRVLRRIKGRHDLSKDDFQALQTVLTEKWPGSREKQPAQLSLALLESEARRLGVTL